MRRIFNFSAGPSMLPDPVLTQIKKELYNWNNLGVSIMEVSHRSLEFSELAYNIKQNLKNLLNIPDNYAVLFCSGGARAQFSAIPMNLLTKSTDSIDYINTGYWGYNAAIEAQKYCNPHIINVLSCNSKSIYSIKPMNQWSVSKNNSYIHYCPNETINGISIFDSPKIFIKNKIIIADCSSMLLSCPININHFGIIYAAAQKNIGIPGLTILIIRKDLIDICKYHQKIPSILNYKILFDNDSMVNTPVSISWYVANLILKWLKNLGGLNKINELNKIKSDLLYNAIDTNNFYYNNISPENRSQMNVVFFLKKEKLNNLFLEECKSFGLYGLKGHKANKGMRASLYNAMPLEGVQKLIRFMQIFSEKNN